MWTWHRKHEDVRPRADVFNAGWILSDGANLIPCALESPAQRTADVPCPDDADVWLHPVTLRGRVDPILFSSLVPFSIIPCLPRASPPPTDARRERYPPTAAHPQDTQRVR
jgi:hypothetical protein